MDTATSSLMVTIKPIPTTQKSKLNRDQSRNRILNPLLSVHWVFVTVLILSLIIWAWVKLQSQNDVKLNVFPSLNLNVNITNAGLTKVPDLIVSTNPVKIPTPSCLIINGTPRICKRDEQIWSELLSHPSLLWHPAPRRVLILGPLGGPLIAESLRHYTLTQITWVSDLDLTKQTRSAKSVLDYTFPFIETKKGFFKDHFQYNSVIDELKRVNVNHQSLHAFLGQSHETSFDVILIDHVLASNSGPSTFSRAQALLSDGGILSVVDQLDSGAGILDHLAAKFKHVHIGLEHVSSTNSNFLFYYATQSDLHLALPTFSPTYINALIGRRISGNFLNHYDGESHLRLFSLPYKMRKSFLKVLAKARLSIKFPTSYAPHPEKMRSLDTPDVKGVSILREYFGCTVIDNDKFLLEVVTQGLGFSRSKIINIDYVHDVLSETDTDELEDEEADFDDSDEPSEVSEGMISVVALLADGHFTLRYHLNENYASAEYSSFDSNNNVLPMEVLGYINEKLDAKRTIGVSIPRGQVMPSANSVVDYWYHGSHYWMNKHVVSKKSPTAGMGQFAAASISKGEVVFKGPIETYLLHDLEISKLPKWRVKYIHHMGEQAEDHVWIAPPKYDEDESYFTNHNCNANLIYQGYDTMIARRDINKGEELTFDYVTADARPKPRIRKCNCGQSSCRGEIHGNDWMRQDVVDRYGVEAFWPHIRKKILRKRAGLPVLSHGND